MPKRQSLKTRSDTWWESNTKSIVEGLKKKIAEAEKRVKTHENSVRNRTREKQFETDKDKKKDIQSGINDDKKKLYEEKKNLTRLNNDLKRIRKEYDDRFTKEDKRKRSRQALWEKEYSKRMKNFPYNKYNEDSERDGSSSSTDGDESSSYSLYDVFEKVKSLVDKAKVERRFDDKGSLCETVSVNKQLNIDLNIYPQGREAIVSVKLRNPDRSMTCIEFSINSWSPGEISINRVLPNNCGGREYKSCLIYLTLLMCNYLDPYVIRVRDYNKYTDSLGVDRDNYRLSRKYKTDGMSDRQQIQKSLQLADDSLNDKKFMYASDYSYFAPYGFEDEFYNIYNPVRCIEKDKNDCPYVKKYDNMSNDTSLKYISMKWKLKKLSYNDEFLNKLKGIKVKDFDLKKLCMALPCHSATKSCQTTDGVTLFKMIAKELQKSSSGNNLEEVIDSDNDRTDQTTTENVSESDTDTSESDNASSSTNETDESGTNETTEETENKDDSSGFGHSRLHRRRRRRRRFGSKSMKSSKKKSLRLFPFSAVVETKNKKSHRAIREYSSPPVSLQILRSNLRHYKPVEWTVSQSNTY